MRLVVITVQITCTCDEHCWLHFKSLLIHIKFRHVLLPQFNAWPLILHLRIIVAICKNLWNCGDLYGDNKSNMHWETTRYCQRRWLPKVCSLDHGNKARVLEFLETVTYLSDLNDHGTPWSFLATTNITHAHYLLFLKYVMVAKWWVFPAMNFTLFDMKPNIQLNKLKQPISGCRFFDSLEILFVFFHVGQFKV